MAHLGPPTTRGQLMALAAMLAFGCAHAAKPAPEPAEDPEVVALRRDNASLRRHVADLEDRVVRLEHEAGHLGPADDRALPVVRLEPPGSAAARTRKVVETDEDAGVRPLRARAPGRKLGEMPNSGTPEGGSDGWTGDGGFSDAGGASGSGSAGSYRLVGDRLVELTKKNAPTRPDRPARDAAGNAVLTEYETAMALYKAGEVAGAERAFELFARAHDRHDYADNALYWKGEAAYDQEHYGDALAAFTEVVERYGGGNKAPDALLKIGLCYGRLGDAANAQDVLRGLVDAYPDARASDIARTRLAELES